MAFEHNGRKYSNADAYRTAKATQAPQKAMTQADGAGEPDGDEQDKSDRPVMTHHNPDGTHKTVHESGAEHDHENLEALKSHLDNFLTEEEHEGGAEQGLDNEQKGY